MRKRGRLIEKGPDKWLVRFYAGRDGKGKKLYPSKLVEGSKKDALKELTRLLAAQDTNDFVKPNQLTVESFSKDFIALKHEVAKSTLGQYQERIDSDILPQLGKHQLAKVTPLMVQRWVLWMKEERTLSPRTIQYSCTVLSMMFNEAKRLHLVASNPTIGVKKPKKVHSEMDIYTAEQMGTLLDAARDTKDPLYPLWDLLLNSGLRPSEAFALTVPDLQGRSVVVSKAVSSGVLGATKTKRGRKVSIPGTTMALLKQHMKQHGIIGGLLFPSELGTYLDLSNVRKRWTKACEAAKLTPIRLYDTRHSHASALLRAGVSLKVVSERLGHASIVITSDVYSHILPEMDENAADAVSIPRKVAIA